MKSTKSAIQRNLLYGSIIIKSIAIGINIKEVANVAVSPTHSAVSIPKYICFLIPLSLKESLMPCDIGTKPDINTRGIIGNICITAATAIPLVNIVTQLSN